MMVSPGPSLRFGIASLVGTCVSDHDAELLDLLGQLHACFLNVHDGGGARPVELRPQLADELSYLFFPVFNFLLVIDRNISSVRKPGLQKAWMVSNITEPSEPSAFTM